MTCHGHESWHPDPEFYYEVGGGPMLDMGPYYLTALVNLIGPIKRVTGSTRITFPERIITSQPKYGKRVHGRDADAHRRRDGLRATARSARSSPASTSGPQTCRGSRSTARQGSLSVPDPNTFGGPVKVRRAGAQEWSTVPLTHSD